ncbi:hypothetical protein ABT282_07930 [Streptomyces sp. NPDC000927]|uniref:hypothetical protein n=1 Tax=Streptomyces sp. NPDC000927 TaxID=3154371 RepID=UPI003324B20F
MAAVIMLAVQSIAVLAAVGLGVWLATKFQKGQHDNDPRASTTMPTAPDITTFLPPASSAQLPDLQQGLAHLGHVLARMESGHARPHEYVEARNLAQWTLDAGKAAEERLARQIGLGEHGDGRMDADTAKSVVARCQAEGISQRTIARITGWSKSWVAEQCITIRNPKKTEAVSA